MNPYEREQKWMGTTSNVQFEAGEPRGKGELYAFVLLVTTVKPDGSEERSERSVRIQGGELVDGGYSDRMISGVVFSGREVIVHGTPDEGGWIRATKIVDKNTGAVTEPRIRGGFLPPIWKIKAHWEGTTSSLQHQPATGQFPDRTKERIAFVLLGMRRRSDGSEERFEKSVVMQPWGGFGGISGEVFNGRSVVVHGEQGEDMWVHAVKIVDKETGAVTEVS